MPLSQQNSADLVKKPHRRSLHFERFLLFSSSTTPSPLPPLLHLSHHFFLPLLLHHLFSSSSSFSTFSTSTKLLVMRVSFMDALVMNVIDIGIMNATIMDVKVYLMLWMLGVEDASIMDVGVMIVIKIGTMDEVSYVEIMAYSSHYLDSNGSSNLEIDSELEETIILLVLAKHHEDNLGGHLS
ncbi:hypothetical protein COCNU_14G005300 [Cocos nucifera]|uniref:Uncharacterized protein n=1 Tax=Cocos nucifera TaxID=13894 RepID=A0A8K0IUR6_COCNU|nr:hypothetical protein COCNU_14G005300 [Cocos nucifera]